jgi:hypothetical protein
MEIKNFLKTHQQTLMLGVGYVLVAGLGFGLGRISAASLNGPEIKVEEAFVPLNYTLNDAQGQSGNVPNPQPGPSPAPTPPPTSGSDCKVGQIKGNIGSSSKVYHMPGGSFYNRTKAEACFDTEAEAQAAGFRKANN